ncbi:FHA domain-containing protein [bacterium]|nr:FHA domain-containing protein [bacterium]
MQFRLTHLSGGHANQIDVVGGTPILLGRDDVCHVRIHREKDLVVSSQHAQIDEAEGGGFQIANLSRNPTPRSGRSLPCRSSHRRELLLPATRRTSS